MVIIVQEPEKLVYYCIGHNNYIDDPYAIAVHKNATMRLGIGHISRSHKCTCRW